MKYPIILLSLLCLSINLLVAQTTYQVQYQNSLGTNTSGLLQLPDGGTITYGYAPSYCETGSNCKGYLHASRFNKNGNLLWNKNYYTNISVYTPQGIATKDGGFVLLGKLYNRAAKTYSGGLVIKCDANGNLLWSKQISSDNFPVFIPQLLAQDKESNILLFYTVNTTDDVSDVLQIVKLNEMGNLVWHKTIYTQALGVGDFYTVSSFLQVENRYLIAGFTNCQVCEGALSANVIQMDTSGRVIDCKDIVANPNNRFIYSTRPNTLLLHNNTLYMLGFYDYEYDYGKNYYFVFPFTNVTKSAQALLFSYNNATLQQHVQQYKNITPFRLDEYSFFAEDGSFVTLSTSRNNILKYDSLGRICPNFIAPATDTSTSSVKLYVTNKNYSIIKEKVYVHDKEVTASSDELDYTLLCSGSSPKIANVAAAISAYNTTEGLHIFPNPVQDIIHIKGLAGGINNIIILSSLGVNVKSTFAASTNFDINISNLSKGIYFIRVIDQNKQSRTYSFVKE